MVASVYKKKSDARYFYAFVWLVITIFEYLLIDTMEFREYTTVSVIISINLILKIVTMYINKIPLISFWGAFIVFYYVFHFGQVFMQGFFPNYEYEYLNYLTIMRDENAVKGTMQLCITCINAFFIGCIIQKSTNVEFNNEFITKNKNNVGWKLLLLFFPFRLLIDGIELVLSSTGGYSATFALGLPGVFSALANMWYACVPLCFIEIENAKRKKQFLIIVLVYITITMLTGNRGHQIVCIASLFIVILLSYRKISIKQYAIFGAAAIIGLYFIDIIYDLRQVGFNTYFNSSVDYTEKNEGGNIVLETLGTFGETIYTPYLVVEGYGSTFKPFFGECFLKSFAAVIPDVTGGLKDINDQAVFPKMLGTESAIGGSFAGEMYYNFGWTYPLFSLLLGIIFYKFSDRITRSLKGGDYNDIMIALPVAVLALWWVRDAVGNMTRQVVWLAILVYILKSRRSVIVKYKR